MKGLVRSGVRSDGPSGTCCGGGAAFTPVPDAGRFTACGLAVMLAVTLAGCLDTRDAKVLENPAADSVVFWPPTMTYARFGDTLHLVVHGLKRQKSCAIPLKVGWNFLRDSTDTEFYEVHSEFELPARGCRRDTAGLDTSFRVRFFTSPGKWLYLRTPEGRTTDSLLFIAPDGPGLVNVIILDHPAGADSTRIGRVVYRDSTASHPVRRLVVDSLATCEVLQTATYESRTTSGDTTRVKVRLLKATIQSAASFAPCAGPHADSVAVVFNRYNFLP